MRAVLLAVTLASLGFGQNSTPAYWRFAPAEPTVLLGGDLRQTRQAGLDRLAAGSLAVDSLGFADEIASFVVAMDPGTGAGEPRFIAVVSGKFDTLKLRRMAVADGARSSRHRAVEMFCSKGICVAVSDGQVLLLGDSASVRAALDRGSAPPAAPRESPVWVRATELAAADAMWVVAPSLYSLTRNQAQSNPLLASIVGMEGGISLRNGFALRLELTTHSAEHAAAVAAVLESAIGARDARPPADPLRAAIVNGTRVRWNGVVVDLETSIDLAALEPALRTLAAGGATNRNGLMDWVIRGAAPVPAPESAPVSTTTARAEARAVEPPPRKQVVRIFGLDDGPREIPLTRAASR